MKTYNVNDIITFTQFGITDTGMITRVIRREEDGSGYYRVQYGECGSETIVCSEEIED